MVRRTIGNSGGADVNSAKKTATTVEAPASKTARLTMRARPDPNATRFSTGPGRAFVGISVLLAVRPSGDEVNPLLALSPDDLRTSCRSQRELSTRSRPVLYKANMNKNRTGVVPGL